MEKMVKNKKTGKDNGPGKSICGKEGISVFPPELLWQCIRKNNCFLKKTKCGKFFSCEPTNLTNFHSIRFSGIVNSKSVGLGFTGTNCSNINLITKNPKRSCQRKPKQVYRTVKLQKSIAELRRITKKIFAYRPDLVPYARKKFIKLMHVKTIDDSKK